MERQLWVMLWQLKIIRSSSADESWPGHRFWCSISFLEVLYCLQARATRQHHIDDDWREVVSPHHKMISHPIIHHCPLSTRESVHVTALCLSASQLGLTRCDPLWQKVNVIDLRGLFLKKNKTKTKKTKNISCPGSLKFVQIFFLLFISPSILHSDEAEVRQYSWQHATPWQKQVVIRGKSVRNCGI